MKRLFPGVLAVAGALTFASLPVAAASAAAAGPSPRTAVAGFGSNTRGQLGTGAVSGSELLPVLAALPPGTHVTQVAPGCFHSLALTSTGGVLAWGDNRSGELGNGAASESSATPAPVPLPAGVRIRSVSGGCAFSLAVSTTGQLWAWGNNSVGQLGNGAPGGFSATPALVHLPAGVRIATAAGGFDHALAVTAGGQVYAWGANGDGQLGNGAAGPATGTPALVHLPDRVQVRAVTAGERDSLAVTTRGRILGWGTQSLGALGNGQSSGFSAVPVPALLPPFVRVRSVFAGCFHTLAVTTTGSVLAFGENGNGQLGTGRGPGNQLVPARTRLPAGTRVTAVGGGCVHSVAVTSRGQMLSWGSGGLLGNGSTAQSSVPVPVRLDRGQIAIGTGGSADGNHSLVLVLRLHAR